MTARDVCFSVQPLQGLSGTKWLLFTVFGGKWLLFTVFERKWLLFTLFFKKRLYLYQGPEKKGVSDEFLEAHASLGPGVTLSQSVCLSVTHSFDKSYVFCELEDLYKSRDDSDVMQSHVKSCKVMQSH